jgi:hypothetical protein
MGSVPDHDMVVQFNLKGAGGCLQFARRLYVLPRWLGIAGGMIVNNNERGGVEDQGALHDLARVDGRVIDGAALLHLIGNETVLAIEKQNSGKRAAPANCSARAGCAPLP